MNQKTVSIQITVGEGEEYKLVSYKHKVDTITKIVNDVMGICLRI